MHISSNRLLESSVIIRARYRSGTENCYSSSSGIFLQQKNVVVTCFAVMVPFLQGSADPDLAVLSDELLVEATSVLKRQWLPMKVTRLLPLQQKTEAAFQSLGCFFQRQHLMDLLLLTFADPITIPKISYPVSPITQTIQEGNRIWIASSPYGAVSPDILSGCLLSGIVSCKIQLISEPGERLAYILTDAKCFSGTEGSPVFNEDGYFIGIVCPNLMKSNGSPLELRCIIPWSMFWKSIDNDSMPDIVKLPSGYQPNATNPVVLSKCSNYDHTNHALSMGVRQVSKSIVAIRIHTSWCSAVIISPLGDVITSAHLLHPYLSSCQTQISPTFKIEISCEAVKNGEWVAAELVYCAPVNSPIDVALVRMKNDRPLNLSFSHYVPLDSFSNNLVGSEIAALGFPFFPPSSDSANNPIVSSGTVSKIVFCRQKPIILLTTASIHNGHSGGMIVNSQGNFLGLITSNAKHSSGGIIPSINFSIPSWMLSPLYDLVAGVESLSGGYSLSAFRIYENDYQIRSLWMLDNDNTYTSNKDDFIKFTDCSTDILDSIPSGISSRL